MEARLAEDGPDGRDASGYASNESGGLEDGARPAGEAIRRQIREELSLTASAGIGSGKSLAKIASDAAKPDGRLLVPTGDEAALPAPRPVRALPRPGP